MNKFKYQICLLALMMVIYHAYGQSSNEVKIGDQIWMVDNLSVDTFRNGDIISEAKTIEEWKKANKLKKPAWCFYDNKPKYGKIYGKLYNWYAVNDSRGLAPDGWHIPSDYEWTTLTDFLGGENEAGPKMKSEKGWKDNYNGNNNSGFTASPGGSRLPQNAIKILKAKSPFSGLGESGCWWSSTELNKNNAWYRLFLKYSCRGGDGSRYDYYKEGGMYVRCLRD